MRIKIKIYPHTSIEPKFGAFYLKNEVSAHGLYLLVQLSWRVAPPYPHILGLALTQILLKFGQYPIQNQFFFLWWLTLDPQGSLLSREFYFSFGRTYNNLTVYWICTGSMLSVNVIHAVNCKPRNLNVWMHGKVSIVRPILYMQFTLLNSSCIVLLLTRMQNVWNSRLCINKENKEEWNNIKN